MLALKNAPRSIPIKQPTELEELQTVESKLSNTLGTELDRSPKGVPINFVQLARLNRD